jgi:hypothetical protein
MGDGGFLAIVKVAGALEGFWLGDGGFLALVKVAGALYGVLASRWCVFSLSEAGWGPGLGSGWVMVGF